MAQQTSQSSTPRRIFLRFRTKDDAPSDSQIIQDFYEFSGLNDTLCFIHWQTREARDTYVVLDVHDGTSVLESSIQDLPHEVYQLSWKSESDAIIFNALDQIAVKEKVLEYTGLFPWCN